MYFIIADRDIYASSPCSRQDNLLLNVDLVRNAFSDSHNASALFICGAIVLPQFSRKRDALVIECKAASGIHANAFAKFQWYQVC